MATVTVTGVVKDETGRKDSRDWKAFSPVYREGSSGEVVTMRSQRVRVVGGVFTAKLEPGVCVLENPDGQRYTVTVPDTDADLWHLVSAAVAFPPDTQAEAVAAAVASYLEDHPPAAGDWNTMLNKPAVIAAGVTQAAARSAIGAAGDVAGAVHDSAPKATPVDADELLLVDSAASFGLKRLTWANLKATVKATNTTRTGVFQFERCNTHTTLGSTIGINTRRVAMLPHTPIRMRLHVRNRDHLADTNGTGTISNFVAYVGQAAVDANGDPNGNFTTTPTQIITSTSISGSTELISGWITPAGTGVDFTKTFVTSIGFTVTATDQIANGGGLHWITYSNSDAGVTAPNPTRTDNQGFFDLTWEYEFADDLAPVILNVSNSASQGGNTASLANRGELDSWGQRWALAAKGVYATLSVGGAWASHFGASSPKWSAYSTLNTPLDVDYVILFDLPSSDICAGTAVATVQASMLAAIAKAKTDYPNARILLTNLSPRSDSTGTPETNRITMNNWLASSPGGVAGCIDIEGPVTDWASPGRIRTRYDSGDGVHGNPAWHAAILDRIPVHRN